MIDDVFKMLDRPMTTDQVRMALAASMQFTCEMFRAFHQFGLNGSVLQRRHVKDVEVLRRALLHRDVLTPEDLEAAEKDLATELMVEGALDPLFQEILDKWQHQDAELEREDEEGTP